jgi:hypothetical protein
MWCCRQTHVQERDRLGGEGKESKGPRPLALPAHGMHVTRPALAAPRALFFNPRAVSVCAASEMGGRTGPHIDRASHLPGRPAGPAAMSRPSVAVRPSSSMHHDS